MGTSADGRNTCSSDVDQYNLQSTVYPDDATQYCPVNVSQPDLTSQWVEDQQKFAHESEESDKDESSPLLSRDLTSMDYTATISPRPNHPDGSSQIKDSRSPERTDYQCVHRFTRNTMQQQQPSQLPGPHQTYVELQCCKARTENLSPSFAAPETSTSFAATSGQSPYIPGPMFGNRTGNRCSGPRRSLEDDEEMFGPSLVAASDLSLQPSPSSPITTCQTGYISMPNPTGAIGGIQDHSTKEDIVSQETCKSDVLEALENPPELAPGWIAPSMYGASSVHPFSGSQ